MKKFNLSQSYDYREFNHEEKLYCTLFEQHQVQVHDRPTFLHMNQIAFFPHVKDLLNRQRNLKPGFTVSFHKICFDEGATHSVTGFKKWFTYLCAPHVQTSYKDLRHVETRIIFGREGKKVCIATIGRANVRVSLPEFTYFDFSSSLIVYNVLTLFSFATQIRLRPINEKHPDKLTAHLQTINVFVPVGFNFNCVYYVPNCDNDFPFSST